MKTQRQSAIENRTTPEMLGAAQDENVAPEIVREEIAAGRAVLPHNPIHANARSVVVGRRFATKINANLGRSPERSGPDEELQKLNLAVRLGAHFIMDLSVGPNIAHIRRRLLRACPAPLGTVPIYEAFNRAQDRIDLLSGDLILETIRDHAEQGVDFMTLHAGVLRRHVETARSRLIGIVSRGGAILAQWMVRQGADNPLFERWDEVLAICAEHDVTVSLGDGLRPGCLADAGDKAQYAELDTLGQLVQRCRKAGVQVMVEGPGHVPFEQIPQQMQRERDVCDDAPFYVLGPVVTDIAPGYDHIAAAIGATAAACHGASLLCYVTPAEHLALPDEADVRQGVTAFLIAAHAADVSRGIPGARQRDDAMTQARAAFDWKRQFELALDGETARERYARGRSGNATEDDHCSMCGREFCALRATREMRQAP